MLTGNWHQGQLNGIGGEWLFPDGTKYRGKWAHNKPNGDGAFYFKPPGHPTLLHYGRYQEVPMEADKKVVWEGQGFVETES